MKRILFFIVTAILSLNVSAQVQINTKRIKIADFTQKITKVVLTGNELFDSYIQSDIKSVWRISPYEFCTQADFERLKSNEDYYFLSFCSGQFKKENEPGLDFITLVKGGEGSEKGLNGMLEVVSIPFRSAYEPSGREFNYTQALLSIIQQYTLDSIEKDIDGYIGLSNYSINLTKSKGKKIVFAKDDLSEQITDNVINTFFKEDMIIEETDDADDYILSGKDGYIVSYTVYTNSNTTGSYCYKMLIDAQSYKLYYFRKHKITKKYGKGFLPEDVKRVALR